MNELQLYRVLLYAGDSLINVISGRCEEVAREDIASWEDAELGRSCQVDPALPDLKAPEVEGSTIPRLPFKFHMVTYETVLGEFNIVTDDKVSADVFMGEFMRALGMDLGGGEIVQCVTYGPPLHVVIIDGLTHMKSVHPSDIVKPVEGDIEPASDDETDIKPGLTD